MSPCQKNAIHQAVISGVIGKERVTNIIKNIRCGDDVVRPHKIDEISRTALKTEMAEFKLRNQGAMKRCLFIEMVQKKARETDIRRGGNGIGSEIKDNRTINTLIKDLGTSLVKGQVVSKARC